MILCLLVGVSNMESMIIILGQIPLSLRIPLFLCIGIFILGGEHLFCSVVRARFGCLAVLEAQLCHAALPFPPFVAALATLDLN